MVGTDRRPLTQDSKAPAKVVSTWSGQAREDAVQRMFTSIAGVYDLNNTLLSFGLHYHWKKITASFITPVGRGTALDVGSGTADLALLLESRMGPKGRVIASDLNHAMLAEGLKRSVGRDSPTRSLRLQASAEHLGFGDNTFDAVTTGFCMRNVGDLPGAVREIRRVMKRVVALYAWSFHARYSGYCERCTIGIRSNCCPGSAPSSPADRTGVYEYLPASIRHFRPRTVVPSSTRCRVSSGVVQEPQRRHCRIHVVQMTSLVIRQTSSAVTRDSHVALHD